MPWATSVDSGVVLFVYTLFHGREILYIEFLKIDQIFAIANFWTKRERMALVFFECSVICNLKKFRDFGEENVAQYFVIINFPS
jgi:hypothetical protein